MKEHPTPRHSDLDALLGGLDPTEAAQLKALWERVGEEEPVAYPGAVEIEQARERLDRAVTADGERRNGHALESWLRRGRARMDRPGREPRGRVLGRFARPASVLAGVLVVLGLLAVYQSFFAPVTRFAGEGERLTVMLPDGSTVELNGGSRVRYMPRFGDERSVSLIGEAFFDVVAEERPFVVRTFNASIRVLGTRFNVRAWRGAHENGTTVTLESGRVELTPTAASEVPIRMEPGQTHSVEQAGSYALDQVSPEVATAWRRGELVYKDQRLGIILDDVERRFAVDIELKPPHLAMVRYTLALREPRTAEGVIRDLSLAIGLQYRETAGGYEMY